MIAAGVFNSGILADPSPGARFNYEAADQTAPARPRPSRRSATVRHAAARGRAPVPAAHPAVASILVGARTPAEVDDALAMYAHPIPGALWHDLKRAGLLAEEAPVPS